MSTTEMKIWAAALLALGILGLLAYVLYIL